MLPAPITLPRIHLPDVVGIVVRDLVGLDAAARGSALRSWWPLFWLTGGAAVAAAAAAAAVWVMSADGRAEGSCRDEERWLLCRCGRDDEESCAAAVEEGGACWAEASRLELRLW